MNILSLVDKFNQGSKVSASEGKVRFEPNVLQGDFKQKKDPEVSEIKDAIESLNKSVIDHIPKVTFSYHEKTKRVIVKVFDENTNEVIREIPARHMIKLQESIQEYLGLMFDKSI